MNSLSYLFIKLPKENLKLSYIRVLKIYLISLKKLTLDLRMDAVLCFEFNLRLMSKVYYLYSWVYVLNIYSYSSYSKYFFERFVILEIIEY